MSTLKKHCKLGEEAASTPLCRSFNLTNAMTETTGFIYKKKVVLGLSMADLFNQKASRLFWEA